MGASQITILSPVEEDTIQEDSKVQRQKALKNARNRKYSYTAKGRWMKMRRAMRARILVNRQRLDDLERLLNE